MFTLDFNIIIKYIKNVDVIDSNDIIVQRLPQSKSYLKILNISYLIKDTNVPISFNIVKRILPLTHIFNNVVLASKPRVIKAFPKSDIAIIWIDIWNIQSSFKTKFLINRYFNVENLIATIWGTNMNPRVPQCIMYNELYKVKHHCDWVWCCKANFKTNPPKLKNQKRQTMSAQLQVH